jgi:DNA helicase-2/ATP-dependent DNA helicase PcrA
LGLGWLIDAVLERSGYKRYVVGEADRGQERWDNIQEFRASARDYGHLGVQDGLTTFLESVALVSDVDNLKEKADAITLITLHQAKGLEFPVVFIIGMEEGILPHIRSMDEAGEMEEERRLCYVGVTRAKERLYLTRAFRRGFRGGSEPNIPSRFLSDIPKNLIDSARLAPPGDLRSSGWVSDDAHPAPLIRLSPGVVGGSVVKTAGQGVMGDSEPGVLLTTGDKVRHAIFGEGIVTSSKPSWGDLEVTVAFKEGHGVKRLLLGFAPLEKIDE